VAAELTFDDGPDPVWTPAILDALADHPAPATFFVIGERARAHPDVVAAVLARGHQVQLHCHEHVRHTEAGRAAIERDTVRALEVLGELGVRPTRWRTPWGDQAPWTAEIARAHGLELVGWTVDTEDWRGDRAETMFAAIAAQLRPGAIVLLHDGLGPGSRRAGCEETVRLTRRIVAG
jgi:peptidoglycan-N-acetylglucosamine deacetylase